MENQIEIEAINHRKKMYYFPLIFGLLPKFGSMCVYWYVFWRLWSNHSLYGIQILWKVSSYEYVTIVIFIF